MTTDRFERRLPEILTEIALPQTPDYTDDILGQTARMRQRPGWTLPERWLPMDLTASTARIGRVPWRTVAVVALLVLAITVAIVVVGSQQRRTVPLFGPAANGSIIYDEAGVIYVTDPLGSPGRPLIAGQDGFGQRFSQDGSTIWFARVVPGGYAIMRANADGSDVRQATTMLLPDTESPTVSPDERELAAILINQYPSTLGLLSLTTDDGIRTLDLGTIEPTRFVAWRPPTGDQLVFLGRPGGVETELGLYVVDRDGTNLRNVLLRHGESMGSQLSFLGGLVLSDDGSMAAYWNWEPGVEQGKDCSIHLIDLNNGQDRRMSYDSSARCELNPAFLADGRLLLERHDASGGLDAQLFVTQADGSEQGTRIGRPWNRGENWAGDPPPWMLSPDRSKVLFVGTDGAAEMISIATGLVEPVHVRIVDGVPSWQRLAPSD
ncbi:MAG TPA: hypothetical protein VF119_00175 [Candidatus Limnocylindrales bacterium]